jgi:hypothetical protein
LKIEANTAEKRRERAPYHGVGETSG